MTIVPGTRLGPYEIVEPIGAGGMGEVFRAKDTRLNRSVAIKVLPSHLSSNPQSRERFDREAKAISSLNHPNICTLHDVGHQDGTDYLVMELVEGETLATRIARGPLPLSQVLRYGAQTAEALAQAHRAGITHRDLKPGNIMITSAGIKLLDFGLAKLVAPAATPGSIDQSGPTALHGPLTAEGTLVGTVQYMSPEQIEGKPVDHRTDIFSLGMILYEMATGRPAFGGSSRASLMSAILSSDPVPVRSLQPALPSTLEQIVLTALEKNPDERWQTAQDVARQLRWIGEASSSGEQKRARSTHGRTVPLLLIGSGIALAAALLSWGGMRLFSGPALKTSSARLHFSLPPDLRPAGFSDTGSFALSPDGRTLCFVAARGDIWSLYLRSADSFEIRKIEGSENASGPFWSSDGEWIGFSARGKMWKANVSGETAPEAICDVPIGGAVASWRDHTILFCDAPGGRPELFRVSDSGGTPVPVIRASPGEWRPAWPWLLPDGRHFLYQSYSADSMERQLVLASLESPEKSLLLKNVSQARVVGKDRLIYVRDGMLLAQRFDASGGKLEGDPVTIAKDVSYFYPTGYAGFDASPTGVVVYRTNTRTTRLSLMNRKGIETKVVDERSLIFSSMALSPDGKKAAVSVSDRATGLLDIWIYDLVRALRDRFTSEPGVEVYPVWSPDGRFIVYSEAQGGTVPHIVRRDLNGSTSEEISPRGEFQIARSFSPDGTSLFVTRRDMLKRTDILRLTMQTKKSEVLIGTDFHEGDPEVSPDGKWLAFVSDVGGTSEIYLQSLSVEKSARIRISSKGGWNPRWGKNSQELFYLSDQSVVVATPNAPERWDDAKLAELFRGPTGMETFSVTPDGESFLILQGWPGPADSLFHVVLGWQ